MSNLSLSFNQPCQRIAANRYPPMRMVIIYLTSFPALSIVLTSAFWSA